MDISCANVVHGRLTLHTAIVGAGIFAMVIVAAFVPTPASKYTMMMVVLILIWILIIQLGYRMLY